MERVVRSPDEWSEHLDALTRHLSVVAPDVSGEQAHVALTPCTCRHFDHVLDVGGRTATAAEHVISLGVETFEFFPLPPLTVSAVDHGR
jgi:hypothetical protein